MSHICQGKGQGEVHLAVLVEGNLLLGQQLVRFLFHCSLYNFCNILFYFLCNETLGQFHIQYSPKRSIRIPNTLKVQH